MNRSEGFARWASRCPCSSPCFCRWSATPSVAPDESSIAPDDWTRMARPPAADDLAAWSTGPPEPIPACETWIERAGIVYVSAAIPVHENRSGTLTCGAPQIVRYRRGPSGIRIKGSPPVTCGLALAMARFDAVLQEEAERFFSSRVIRIEHLGTYNCREMAAYPGWVSEHSYANGIDFRRFILANGKTIEVLGHYGDGVSDTQDRSTLFLRAIARRAVVEDIFSVVITPAFDRLHRNHIHVDMARYRVDGTRHDPAGS